MGCLNTVTLGSLGSFTLHLSECERLHAGKWTLASPVAHAWLWVGAGVSWNSNCHARVWRNRKPSSNLKGKKTCGMESGLWKRASACQRSDKERFWWQGDGPEKKKKDTGKWYDLVFVPLTSVPKEKNGELFEGLIFYNIVNAIWRERKIACASESRAGPSSVDGPRSVSLHTPGSNVFLKHLRLTLSLKVKHSYCWCFFFLLDHT